MFETRISCSAYSICSFITQFTHHILIYDEMVCSVVPLRLHTCCLFSAFTPIDLLYLFFNLLQSLGTVVERIVTELTLFTLKICSLSTSLVYSLLNIHTTLSKKYTHPGGNSTGPALQKVCRQQVVTEKDFHSHAHIHAE